MGGAGKGSAMDDGSVCGGIRVSKDLVEERGGVLDCRKRSLSEKKASRGRGRYSECVVGQSQSEKRMGNLTGRA